MPGKLRRSRRETLREKQWRSLEEKGSVQLEQPKLTRWVLHLTGTHLAPQPNIPLVPLESPPPMPPSRSRTYESSCKEAEQAATGRQGPPSPSVSLGVPELSEEQNPSTSPMGSAGRSLGAGTEGGLVPVLWQT